MSKFFAYLGSPAFRKTLIAIILFFVLIFVGIYFGLRIYTKHGSSQQVPDLKGVNINQAIKTLEQAGLEYEIDSVYQLDAQPGQVIDQDPDPQVQVKSGRTIYLTTITQSAPEIAFPEIVDKTYIEASAILKNHSIKISDTSYVNDIARDVVLEAKFAGQDIPAGRMVPKGSSIALVLGNGRGNSEVDLPNLIGYRLNEAKFALAGLGLTVGNVSFDSVDSDTQSAVVVAQSPSPEVQTVPIGSAVHLTLGKPDQVESPLSPQLP